MSEPNLDRRELLRGGGAAAAAGALSLAAGRPAAAAAKVPIVALADLKPGVPVEFDYPEGAPALLVDLGERVEGGVGPNGSILAVSTLCQHMGCPVKWDPTSRELVCHCHGSRYDLVRGGMAVEGAATRGLPRIALAVEDGRIVATGVADGLVYGFACHA
jgi:arsenite oxidase small subunit